MKIKLIFTFFLVVFQITIISSNEVNKNYITINKFIESALKNSHIKEIIKDELIAVYDEKLKVPPGDLILSILGEYDLNYDNYLFHNMKTSVALSKLFLFSGTAINAEYSINPQIDYSIESKINFMIEQDIINNAFGRIARIKKDIAGNEHDIAYYQIIEIYEDYIINLVKIFINWYSSYENLMLAKNRLKESQILLKNVEKRVERNKSAINDYYKSRLQVISKQEELAEMECIYQKYLIQINDIIVYEENEYDILPVFESNVDDFNINLEDTFEEFKKNSRSIKMIQLVNKIDHLKNKVFLNDLLPTAKLYGGYTFTGENYLFENYSHQAVFGLKFDFYIPQNGSLAKYKKQKTIIQKNKLYEMNSIKNFSIDLNLLFKDLECKKTRIKLSNQKNIISLKALEKELERYNHGKSSLDDLILFYDAYEKNQVEHVNLIVEFYQYYLEWLRITDTFVTNNKKINIINENKNDDQKSNY